MQGCLKSALWTLKTANLGEPGPLYVMLFNYSIGLERLLKLIFVLDYSCNSNGAFPSSNTLKNEFGHDLVKLHDKVKTLSPGMMNRIKN